MPNTESEVIQTILKNGGKAKKGAIVKGLGIGLGYLDIIIRSLERRGLVKVNNNICSLTSLGKKKLAEFIQKKGKAKLETNKKRGRPRGKWHPKEQKADFPVAVAEVVSSVEPQRSVPEEPPVEVLLGQRIGELKEKVAEAEKKVEEGLENIEEKIEEKLEKKLGTVEENAKPTVNKIEELPPIILQFGKFLLSTGKKIFNKFKKIKNVKFSKSRALLIQQPTDVEKQVTKASAIFIKLRNFKVRGRLTSVPVWISKNYKNLTKKRS